MVVRLSDLMGACTGAFTGYNECWDQVMCCLCFEMTDHDDLEPVSNEPPKRWDVCKPCAHHEKQHGAEY